MAAKMAAAGMLSPAERWGNLALMFLAAVPSVVMLYWVPWACFEGGTRFLPGPESAVCSMAVKRPLLYLQVWFLLCIDVLFWALALLQRSTWLIDPYWTFIPMLIGAFLRWHPQADSRIASFAADEEDAELGHGHGHGHGHVMRSAVSLALLCLWSVRLTHSYFRREEWQFGHREDWRFENKRKEVGPKHWWWFSFFYVYVPQQAMLVGVMLPFYSTHFLSLHQPGVVPAPWGLADTVLCVLAFLGLCTGYFADTQLREYMLENERRSERGQPRMRLLNTGLWKWSRHPNYFGESLWWVAIGGLCVTNSGGVVWWPLLGPLFNVGILLAVVPMVEKRMLDVPARADIYREYQRCTSMFILWPQGYSARLDRLAMGKEC